MPFVLITLGLILVVAGVRGKADDLLSLLKNDFTGSPSFLPWIFSIIVIGSLGYISNLRTISRSFLVLIIVVLFLKNGGFFSQLQKGLPEAFGGKTQ